MVLVKINNVKKYYGDRLVLDIDNFEVLDGEKIGVVGKNGAGKTTLLKIILGKIEPDEGNIQLSNSYSYIDQKEDYMGYSTSGKTKSLLDVPESYNEFLSGGEKVKLRINEAFSKDSSILIADEPTCNLDSETINKIENMLKGYKGALILVSHDRNLLDNLCNNILEIEDGKCRLYKGNYSKYLELKAKEREKAEKEFNNYISEKERLQQVIIEKENKRNSIKKAPRRFGNSEARLCKMGDQRAKRNLDGNIKALKSRISQLEVKEKPKSVKETKIKINKGCEMISNTVVEVCDLVLSINDSILINKFSFKINRGKKVALIGENGCGKTTLLKKILNCNEETVKLSKCISIGYFDQSQDILDKDKSILENIKESSSYDEGFIRINLDGFGFKGDDVFKKVSVLSGGEVVKVALCKIILGDNNTLILDEPTNYLDIKAIEALENAVKNTDKTVIIVSHDRKFISHVCDFILEIKNKELIVFNGIYNDYVSENEDNKMRKSKAASERVKKERLIILENKAIEIISRISIEKDTSIKDKLNNEYLYVLKEIRELKLL